VKIKCCEEKLREGTRTNKKWAWREVSFRVKCQGGVFMVVLYWAEEESLYSRFFRLLLMGRIHHMF
jgi:hypothetical protein